MQSTAGSRETSLATVQRAVFEEHQFPFWVVEGYGGHFPSIPVLSPPKKALSFPSEPHPVGKAFPFLARGLDLT